MYGGQLQRIGHNDFAFFEKREARPDMDAKLNSETHLKNKF